MSLNPEIEPPQADIGESLPGKPPVGRLAPSPTGVLHLGNARSFLLAWLSIRQQGGKLLLRIEDLDGPRIKAGATASASEDLEWLGLDWDEEIRIQSHHLPLHEKALQDLISAGLAYPCCCTRKEIEEAASAPHEQVSSGDHPSETIYPGTCRGRWGSMEEAAEATGRDPALRLLVEEPAIPFFDDFRGQEEGLLNGDFVLSKRDGTPSYQLAVVVDDALDGISEVLRADDLIPSTPRQLLLYRHLGGIPPRHIHVPLIVGPDGKRLAKRHGDTSLAYYRRQGISPEEIIGALAHLCGWAPRGARLRPADLVADFQLDRLPSEPMVWEDERYLTADH